MHDSLTHGGVHEIPRVIENYRVTKNYENMGNIHSPNLKMHFPGRLSNSRRGQGPPMDTGLVMSVNRRHCTQL